MAAPVVAGVAAMVRYANPNLTPTQVANILYETATDVHTVGRDAQTGHGVVNAEAAVRRALGNNVTVSVASGGVFRARVNWNNVPGATGYRVFRKLSTEANFLDTPLTTITGSSTLTYTDSTVLAGTS